MDVELYKRLVRKVRLFNEEAAEYMEFYAINNVESFKYGGSLMSCFRWDDTPYRQSFWSDLHIIK